MCKIKEISLIKVLALMQEINSTKSHESFFEGRGNGEVEMIIQEIKVTI